MTLRGTLDAHRSNKSIARPVWRLKLRWLLLLVLLPSCWLGYREIRGYFEQPQAMLVLGGAVERENFAAEFARQHPELPIWVSGGSNPEYTQGVFADAGIDPRRLHIDREAVDTVTNFTTLVEQFRAKGISRVYLITSDYHMRRARIIGEVVFGSRGILLQPVSVPSNHDMEPLSKSLRDGARAILWVATGHTGSSLRHHHDSQDGDKSLQSK